MNIRSPFTENVYPVSELTPPDVIKKAESFQKRQEGPPVKPKPLHFSRDFKPADREPKTTREKREPYLMPSSSKSSTAKATNPNNLTATYTDCASVKFSLFKKFLKKNIVANC